MEDPLRAPRRRWDDPDSDESGPEDHPQTDQGLPGDDDSEEDGWPWI